ncbi:MAG TPA: hypothetical protein VE270_04665, partial [Thermoleophilaceae bacterium]|nr:hypothetical protein [Thermoleophilaceae bacterium]
ASVQNRVRELVAETMARSREDLIKQFSAADGSNPLADFKAGTIRVLKAAEERQHESQQALLRQMAELEKQLQALHLEKEKLEAVDAEREKGPPPRAVPSRSRSRSPSTGSPWARATSPKRSGTSRRPPARSATSWWRSTPRMARRAAG